MSIKSSIETVPAVENPNGLELFRKHLVLSDLPLSLELFASHGDMVFICGKDNQRKEGFMLVAYEIPSVVASFACNIRLFKTIRLDKKKIQQLETVSALKILLLLADGIITIYDVNSLIEIGLISNNTAFFTTT